MQRRDALRHLQVERDAALAAVEFMEVQRVTMAEGGAHLPRIVAAIGFLHLDDCGAEIGEDGAREGPGQDLAELNDLDAGENGHVAGSTVPRHSPKPMVT